MESLRPAPLAATVAAHREAKQNTINQTNKTLTGSESTLEMYGGGNQPVDHQRR